VVYCLQLIEVKASMEEIFMDKTKKIEKFFETRKMSLEKNNACVQAKYPNI
jgi:hypothetical protein